MIASIREQFHIDPAHPCLPGHFPGAPVVPGVVLLERIATIIERAFGARIAGLPQVKFLRPLRPGETADICIDCERERFDIWHAGERIASGVLELLP